MNKTAIKNFAVWARNKLIADITYKAGLIGVSEKGIAEPLPQSSRDLQFFDIGTKDYAQVSGKEIEQRKSLVNAIQEKESTSDYATAFKYIIEEIAYTWFNRLIAIRFMEINDYLPSGIRVLSSENPAKHEPDFVTSPFEAELDLTPAEEDKVMQLKDENKLDELFRMLFIRQCNKLSEILPELFEKTNDYTELLLNISFTDKDGVVYHLVHDIEEKDFDISTEDEDGKTPGQVEIIGWMYQYYNIEPKDETFALLKKNVKITKERIPAATQLFTPDWIVRYMVENSLGRLWVEGHPNEELKANWKYYLEEAQQEPEVQAQLEEIRAEYRKLNPEEIQLMDCCAGSGHILVYAFDVLMQIYESQGYTQRDAAQSILQNNLYGLDIDKRAAQLAYFAVMMKARQYDRRIFTREIKPHVYAIEESNGINRDQLKYFGAGLNVMEKNQAVLEMTGLLDTLVDAKEYGSILNVENYNWDLLRRFVDRTDDDGQMNFETIGIEVTQEKLHQLVEIGEVMARKYHTVVTNPPYASVGNLSAKISHFVKKNYPESKADLFAVFIERCQHMMTQNGYQGMITQHAWMFLTSYEKLRKNMMKIETVNMAHLGARAFEEIGGEVVQTTSFVRWCNHIENYKGTYCRLTEPTSQQKKEEMFLDRANLFQAKQSDFLLIPGSSFAYWASDKALRWFASKPIADYALLCQGLTTTDNEKYVRQWHEPQINNIGFHMDALSAIKSTKKWFPFNKGGGFCKWYGNNDLVVNYENDGRAIKEDVLRKYTYLKTPDFVVKNSKTYFLEGLTWSALSNVFSIRWFPEGAICADKGQGLFADNDKLYYSCGLLNSNVAKMYLKLISPTLDFNCGYVRKVPYVVEETKIDEINALVKMNIHLARQDWDSFENSWDFKEHPLVTYRHSVSKVQIDPDWNHMSYLMEEAFHAWEYQCTLRYDSLKHNEEELNRIFIDIYGLQDELTPEVEDKDVTVRKAELQRDIRSLISYAVGCMFGRYSLDKPGLAYAGGNWNDVFKHDPTVLDIDKNDGSKAVLAGDYIVGEDGQYHPCTFVPDADNCIPITDEPYFEDDIVGLFCAWLKKVYGEETLEENLDFIAKALGNKGATSREVIRNYFLKDFFTDHCKIYQKRPIYWLFDSGKQNGFKALVYMHRWNADTVGNLRVEYLHKMQHTYEREILRMQETIDNSHDSREISRATKRKDKLQKQLKETKDYDARLAHIALSRIDIDLDDGVKANYEKVQTARDGQKMQILAKI